MPRHAKIPLAIMPWGPGGHPLERKKHDPSLPVTLLEFAPGFADPNWCARGHAGYVLNGKLSIEYEEGVEIIEEAEAFFVQNGVRHRASNPGTGAVRLFIVSWEAGGAIEAGALPTPVEIS